MRSLPSCGRFACGFVLVWGLLAASVVQASPWARVQTVAPGSPDAIGGPSNGCIAGAQALPREGIGYVSIRRHRNRFYGHPDTVRFVTELGRALSERTEKVMMVGDLSQPRGGPMSSMHRSHQNGMDVDIWFQLTGSARSADKQHPEERDPQSMVAPGGYRLTGDWTKHQRFLLKASAENPRVDRIFVNPAIKRALCRSEAADRSWLGKLRPWWGHDAHFHVRLKCAENGTRCRQQASIPTGDGCDGTLDWWFSEEARTPSKKPKGQRPKPALPAACTALIAAGAVSSR